MKKNIIIGVLFLTTVFSFVWGLTQPIESARQRKFVIELTEEAEMQPVIAEEERARAEMARIVAEEVSNRAREAVELTTIEAEKAREVANIK